MNLSAAARLLVLCLLLTAACKQREPVANEPLRPRGVAPGLPPSQESPAQLPSRTDVPLAQLTSKDSVPDPGTTTAEEAAPDSPEQPRRNLSGELESMMGSPVDCLEARPASSASSLNIALSANVMPSGAVGRGEVSAPGLRPAEVACLRSRVESLRFAQPIENAPLTVSGSLTLTPQVAPAPATPQPTAADGGMQQ